MSVATDMTSAISHSMARIDGFEVFLVLTLFCTASDVDEQLALCFRLFDVDDSGDMSQVRQVACRVYVVVRAAVSSYDE